MFGTLFDTRTKNLFQLLCRKWQTLFEIRCFPQSCGGEGIVFGGWSNLAHAPVVEHTSGDGTFLDANGFLAFSSFLDGSV